MYLSAYTQFVSMWCKHVFLALNVQLYLVLSLFSRTIVRGASSLTSDRVMSSDGSFSSDCTCHYTVYHIFGKEDKEVCWGGAYSKGGAYLIILDKKGAVIRRGAQI